MATSSKFLSIRRPEPNINTGITIRVLDYKDLKSLVAIAYDITAVSFTQELNGSGTGSITLDEDSRFWADILENGKSRRALLDNEYVFEAWINGVPRFAWLGQTVEQTVTGDDETRAITISGPGIAQVLTWAVINRPGWPTKPPILKHQVSTADPTKTIPIYRDVSYNDKLPAFLWQFPVKWPTMRMWYTVFRAAQRRGVVKFVTPAFTATTDTNGKPWQDISTIDEVATKEGYRPQEPSQNLLDFLNDCTGQDYSKWFGQRLEWLMRPSFKLDVRPTIGVDRSAGIRFFSGNIVSDQRTRDREAIYNRIIAVDVVGNESNRTDAKSVTAWNLREQRNETNKNVTDDTLRGQLADRYLIQSKDQKDQWTVKVPFTDPGRQPFANFGVGDTIAINEVYAGMLPVTSDPMKFRVMAITISLAADQIVPDVELTLKSIIDLKMDDLQKQITQLLNNPRNVSLNDLKEVHISSTPTTKSKLVYDPDTKTWTAEPDTTSSGDSGVSVYIRNTDPASDTAVSVGDFWLDTTGM